MSVILIFCGSLALAEDAAATQTAAPTPLISDADPAVASSDPRVVETVEITLEVEDLTGLTTQLRAAIESAGGTIIRHQDDHDSDWGDTIFLQALVPIQSWPAVESSLALGPDDALDRAAVPRSAQEGDGPPHVEVSIDLALPTEREPNFLVGASGALLLPADATGPGLAPLVSMRVMNPYRDGSLEVSYAPSAGLFRAQDAPWMLQITGGGAMYSDYLGSGERTFLNPFIGGQLGYAYRGQSWFVLQAELGLELLHIHHVILDVYARPTGYFRKGSVGLAVETGMGLVFPF